MNLSFSHLWFRFIHQNFLIYAMCWEDEQVDRSLLGFDTSSNILMITSAGCNALSYLLDEPNLIHSVDINHRQNALLDLKLKMIKYTDQSSFYNFFWYGKSKNYLEIYDSIKSTLAPESRYFWNTHIHYFKANGKGLIFYGGSGVFARFLNLVIKRKRLRTSILELATETDLTNREIQFKQIEKKLWSGLEKKLWSSSVFLSLAGIPIEQQNAIGDIHLFCRKSLKQIFVDQGAVNNPYWGRYLCLPALTPDDNSVYHPSNFLTLKRNADKITFQTISIIHHLENTFQNYNHFVLLDHMDWLVKNNKHQLNRLWELIIDRSESNSKILFRTAFSDINFIPLVVHHFFNFKKIDNDWLLKHDRVGTYTGTYIGIKK